MNTATALPSSAPASAAMPNFLDNIFAKLRRGSERVVLRELHDQQFVSVTGRELLEQVRHARSYLRRSGLQAGDRCALLASNSIAWAALDLALMAEGLVVVPLYSRAAPTELVAVLKDSEPRYLFVGEESLAETVKKAWPNGSAAPASVLLADVFSAPDLIPPLADAPTPRSDSDLVTIMYTSGTSGEAKGVCLKVANVTFMLSRTSERLNQLMGGATRETERVFQYLPFNFTASWMALLTFLSRDSVVALSSDLTRLAEEIRLAAPHYFLNVPTLLERVRRGVEDTLTKRSWIIRSLFAQARDAWKRRHAGRGGTGDAVWLALGRKLIFSKIRERFGPHLRALICGSAPLAAETQQFFLMLGIPVLQVYGLTETTGICTMDDPRLPLEPGYVGAAIPGMDMRVAENDEIVVRGPNVFSGYWHRPEDTARVLSEGWFHTGDQGEVNVRGNWRIIGRVKNLVILNSGHKIPPEPIEEKIRNLLPAAQQVVVVGNGRGYLSVLVVGPVATAAVQSALDSINPEVPHYRQIRQFTVLTEPFTAENGLLTVTGKLRREAINARFAQEIASLYERKSE